VEQVTNTHIELPEDSSYSPKEHPGNMSQEHNKPSMNRDVN
jgi:hypothetical protein